MINKTIAFFKQNRPLFEKINFYLAIAIVFMLPLYGKIIPKIIVLWIISWLLEGNFKQKFAKKSNKHLLFIPIFFYLFHILGLLYSDNLKTALFDIEVKLSLFIFPILLFASNQLYYKNKNSILYAFVLGNLVAALVCILNVFINRMFYNNEYEFYYQSLSILMHTTYFSMYLTFSIVILIKFLYSGCFTSRFINISNYLIIVFFLILIFLLSSRAGIISSAMILIGFSIILLRKRIKVFYKVSFIIIAIFFIISVLKYNGRLNYGLKQLSSSSYNKTNNKISSSNDRLMMWISSFKIVKNNFLLGIGAGDIKEELMIVYKENNLDDAFKSKLNLHNQFLETFIGQGFVGLLLIFLMLFLPFVSAIKKKNILLLFFLIVIGINFLFESMLNTQAGVVFFVFFYCLLVFIDKTQIIKNNLPSTS